MSLFAKPTVQIYLKNLFYFNFRRVYFISFSHLRDENDAECQYCGWHYNQDQEGPRWISCSNYFEGCYDCFWQDKRLVRILRTMHVNILVPTGKIDHKKQIPIINPRCVMITTWIWEVLINRYDAKFNRLY